MDLDVQPSLSVGSSGKVHRGQPVKRLGVDRRQHAFRFRGGRKEREIGRGRKKIEQEKQ